MLITVSNLHNTIKSVRQPQSEKYLQNSRHGLVVSLRQYTRIQTMYNTFIHAETYTKHQWHQEENLIKTTTILQQEKPRTLASELTVLYEKHTHTYD